MKQVKPSSICVHEIKIPTDEELDEIRRKYYDKIENQEEFKAAPKVQFASNIKHFIGNGGTRIQDLTIVEEEQSEIQSTQYECMLDYPEYKKITWLSDNLSN